MNEFRSELCYLGTFAADRQRALDQLFVQAARRQPDKRFAIGGAQCPNNFPWTPNIFFVRHLPPSLHPAFFCSARATLNQQASDDDTSRFRSDKKRSLDGQRLNSKAIK